jgi:flagellar hook-associated protein 2
VSSIFPTTAPATGSSATGNTPALFSTASTGTVSSTGLGSGLDINSIVSQLVAAEGSGQQTLLNSQQTALQTQLSAYGQFQAAVSALQASVATLATSAQFQVNAATVGDPTIASATADTTAATGTYSLEVTALAAGAQLTSAPVATAGTVVGTGVLSIKVGASSFQVNIDSTNNTLAEIAGAIAAAGAAHGIGATVLTANDGARLLLTSAATGAVNAVSVTQSGGDGGLASLVYDAANPAGNTLTLTQAAADAGIKINGFAYTSSSNVVTTALPGVTISLKGKSALGVTTPLTIATDPSSSQAAVQSFIGSYNTLASAIGQLTSYNATTGSAGPLLGDSLLNTFVSQLNGIIDASVGGLKGAPFSTLAEIGIVANTDGTLGANAKLLNGAFANNYASIGKLFAGPGGVATRLNALLNSYTQPVTGVLASQSASLQQSLADIATQRTALNQRLADLQTSLLAQYNAMDQLVGQLKSTNTAIQAQLNAVYYPGKALGAIP